MSVPHHPLGKNGPLVPALGLGLMGLSYASYGSIGTDEERLVFLDRAYELGARFWDSADLYGDGEELLGKWFKRTGKREKVFLATKFGFVLGSPTREVNSSASYCRKACEDSLRRLDIDSIDLYYAHSVNPETPIEETVRAMAELKAQGKIKHIGLSSVDAGTLRRAYAVAPIAAVQTEYSLFMRDIEGSAGTDLLSACRELGVALVIATPLGRGLLTPSFTSGQIGEDSTDSRPKLMPHFLGENRGNNLGVVRSFEEIAAKKGYSGPQIALAWLLKQGDDIFPIPGTKKIKYLEENWASLKIQLSDEEEAELRAFADSNPLAGGSVPPAFEGYRFRSTREEST